MKMIQWMPFLSLSNADVKFAKLRKLTWKTYIAIEALFITSQVKLIDKKKFVKAALDEISEIFVMYASALKATTIYPFQAAQIVAL